VLVAAGGGIHRSSVAAPGAVEPVADVQAPGVLRQVVSLVNELPNSPLYGYRRV